MLDARIDILARMGLLRTDEMAKLREIQALSDNPEYQAQATDLAISLMCGYGSQLKDRSPSDWTGPRTINECLEKNPETGKNFFEKLRDDCERAAQTSDVTPIQAASGMKLGS